MCLSIYNFCLQGAKKDTANSKVDTTTVVMDVVFQCSGDDFYNVLTTPDVCILNMYSND